MNMPNYNLQRFLDAQQSDYEQALTEVETGGNIPTGFEYIFSSTERVGHEL